MSEYTKEYINHIETLEELNSIDNDIYNIPALKEHAKRRNFFLETRKEIEKASKNMDELDALWKKLLMPDSLNNYDKKNGYPGYIKPLIDIIDQEKLKIKEKLNKNIYSVISE